IGVESDVGIGALSVGLCHQGPLVTGFGLETAQSAAAVAPADLAQPRAGGVSRQGRAADRQDVRRSSGILRRRGAIAGRGYERNAGVASGSCKDAVETHFAG